MSMIEDILSQMQGQPTQQVASQLGVDPSQASTAIAAALPMLIGALGHNASQPGGAEQIAGVLGDHAESAQGGLGGLLGSVLGGLGGAQPTTPQNNGAGILGHIFGGREQQAAGNVGQVSGLDTQKSHLLLKILAPIVMAYLAKRLFSRSASAQPTGEDVNQVLGQEHASVQQGGGLLGSILGGADGKVDVGDILRMGSSVLGGRL